MALTIILGVPISKELFNFFSIANGSIISKLHILFSYWGMLFLAMHIGLHIKTIFVIAIITYNFERIINLNSDKILVIYFSETGNTQKLAKLISDKVGGDFVRIETEKVYPEDYDELVDDAKKEKDNNDRPKLKELNINLENYDTIFVGYPIWWYQMPMAMYTFFDNYDFANKTIIPFNTHEGSGSSGTYEDIQKLEPKAKVLEGLPIRGGDMTSDQSNKVDNWLKNLDI